MAQQNSADGLNLCPEKWFDIRLPEGSKTCRVFGVKKPSTLSFFIKSTPEIVSESLAAQLNTASVAKQGKYLTLRSQDKQYRAYIYADGPGTQVNLIVN